MCTHIPRRHLLVVNVLSGAYDKSLVLETPPKLTDSGMDKHNGISCSRSNEWSITTHINTVGSHQQDGEGKQPDTEAYVLHNSICINRKTGNANVCFWSQSPGWSLILWMDLILWFWTENAEATKMPGRGQHPHGDAEVCRKKWSPENEGRGWPLDFEPLWDLFCLYLPRLADIFSFLPQEEMPLSESGFPTSILLIFWYKYLLGELVLCLQECLTELSKSPTYKPSSCELSCPIMWVHVSDIHCHVHVSSTSVAVLWHTWLSCVCLSFTHCSDQSCPTLWHPYGLYPSTLSLRFSWQESWSGVLFPPPGPFDWDHRR